MSLTPKNINRRVGNQITSVADRLMTTLLGLLSSSLKNSLILEDVFLAVGSIIQALEVDFERYLETFMPFLLSAIANHEEHQLCSIAVGVIGDICRALNEKTQLYANAFMNSLLTVLQVKQICNPERRIIQRR